MANEIVEVKSGTGITIAVDETSEGNVQIIKQAVSADGSRALIPADANGLAVQERRSEAIQTATEGILAALGGTLTVSGDLAVTDVATEDTAASILTAVNAMAALIVTAHIEVREVDAGAIKTAVQALAAIISGGRFLTQDGSTAAIKTATEAVSAIISGGKLLVTETSGAAILAALSALSVTVSGSVTVAPDGPDATATYAASEVHSTAYEASHVVKATPGVLYQVNGFNSLTTPQFIQIHNATALPSEAAVPLMILWVDGLSNFTWDCGRFGMYCSTGIVVCNSSTGPTKTIGSADCWFNCLFK